MSYLFGEAPKASVFDGVTKSLDGLLNSGWGSRLAEVARKNTALLWTNWTKWTGVFWSYWGVWWSSWYKDVHQVIKEPHVVIKNTKTYPSIALAIAIFILLGGLIYYTFVRYRRVRETKKRSRAQASERRKNQEARRKSRSPRDSHKKKERSPWRLNSPCPKGVREYFVGERRVRGGRSARRSSSRSSSPALTPRGKAIAPKWNTPLSAPGTPVTPRKGGSLATTPRNVSSRLESQNAKCAAGIVSNIRSSFSRVVNLSDRKTVQTKIATDLLDLPPHTLPRSMNASMAAMVDGKSSSRLKHESGFVPSTGVRSLTESTLKPQRGNADSEAILARSRIWKSLFPPGSCIGKDTPRMMSTRSKRVFGKQLGTRSKAGTMADKLYFWQRLFNEKLAQVQGMATQASMTSAGSTSSGTTVTGLSSHEPHHTLLKTLATVNTDDLVLNLNKINGLALDPRQRALHPVTRQLKHTEQMHIPMPEKMNETTRLYSLLAEERKKTDDLNYRYQMACNRIDELEVLQTPLRTMVGDELFESSFLAGFTSHMQDRQIVKLYADLENKFNNLLSKTKSDIENQKTRYENLRKSMQEKEKKYQKQFKTTVKGQFTAPAQKDANNKTPADNSKDTLNDWKDEGKSAAKDDNFEDLKNRLKGEIATQNELKRKNCEWEDKYKVLQNKLVRERLLHQETLRKYNLPANAPDVVLTDATVAGSKGCRNAALNLPDGTMEKVIAAVQSGESGYTATGVSTPVMEKFGIFDKTIETDLTNFTKQLEALRNRVNWVTADIETRLAEIEYTHGGTMDASGGNYARAPIVAPPGIGDALAAPLQDASTMQISIPKSQSTPRDPPARSPAAKTPSTGSNDSKKARKVPLSQDSTVISENTTPSASGPKGTLEKRAIDDNFVDRTQFQTAYQSGGAASASGTTDGDGAAHRRFQTAFQAQDDMRAIAPAATDVDTNRACVIVLKKLAAAIESMVTETRAMKSAKQKLESYQSKLLMFFQAQQEQITITFHKKVAEKNLAELEEFIRLHSGVQKQCGQQKIQYAQILLRHQQSVLKDFLKLRDFITVRMEDYNSRLRAWKKLCVEDDPDTRVCITSPREKALAREMSAISKQVAAQDTAAGLANILDRGNNFTRDTSPIGLGRYATGGDWAGNKSNSATYGTANFNNAPGGKDNALLNFNTNNANYYNPVVKNNYGAKLGMMGYPLEKRVDDYNVAAFDPFKSLEFPVIPDHPFADASYRNGNVGSADLNFAERMKSLIQEASSINMPNSGINYPIPGPKSISAQRSPRSARKSPRAPAVTAAASDGKSPRSSTPRRENSDSSPKDLKNMLNGESKASKSSGDDQMNTSATSDSSSPSSKKKKSTRKSSPGKVEESTKGKISGTVRKAGTVVKKATPSQSETLERKPAGIKKTNIRKTT